MNHYVNSKQFKMESLNVFKIIKKGVRMNNVDLKDALFIVPVHNLDNFFFKKIEWTGKFYQFFGMPNFFRML